MADDHAAVIGDRLPDFDTVLAALKSQIDPAKLTVLDSARLDNAVVEKDRYSVLQILIAAGADPGKFRWNDIFLAIAFGTIDDLEEALTGKTDVEAIDGAGRSAFHFAVQLGDIAKARLVLEAGAHITPVGVSDRTSLDYAIRQDNVPMLEWLLEKGVDPEQKNGFGETAVFSAAAAGAIGCLKKLVAVGADITEPRHSGSTPLSIARDPQVIQLLLDAGADLNALDPEQISELLGYKFDEPPDCSLETYTRFKSRAFGRFNPERVFNPFWTAMVQCGGPASLAEMKFAAQARALRKNKAKVSDRQPQTKWSDPRPKPGTGMDFNTGYPIWCHRRFGKTINRLPDGRYIEIAGEHEDFYDLNFSIYNDVIVHDGQGQFEIYAYPAEVFPPTDFHTATLVGAFIYIIGNLGYAPDRRPGFTPVYRLDIHTYRIEPVETTGEMPGWIHRHEARYDGRSGIRISGGRCTVMDGNDLENVENYAVFELDLHSRRWAKKG